MIWPTCSLVKLTGENIGLVPGIRHLIDPKVLAISEEFELGTNIFHAQQVLTPLGHNTDDILV